jgi:cytochrome P450
MSVVPVYEPDIFSDEALLDPYEHYRAIRDLGPVVWLEAQRVYILARYADVRAALADAETFRSGQGVGLNDNVNQAGRGTTLMSDDEIHREQRKLAFNELTPKALLGLRATVEQAAVAVVDELVARGRFDAVADLARVLPLSVVPDLVGWPRDGRAHLLDWASASFDALGPDNARARQAAPRLGHMIEFAQRTVAEGNLIPGSIGAGVLEAARRGEISLERLPAIMIDYAAPSMDTTISAIGSAVWLLARHPEQWDDLRANPGLMTRAFNEVVRMESPIRCFSRIATREVVVDGTVVPAGARVTLHYASANRDERYWTRPDEFDIHRPRAGTHLGFGHGTHNCPGQGLARLEGHALLGALVARVDRITIGTPTRAMNNIINAFATLPVAVTPGAGPAVNATASCPAGREDQQFSVVPVGPEGGPRH